MATYDTSKPGAFFRSIIGTRAVRRVATPHLPFNPFGLTPVAGLVLLFLFAMIPFARGVIEQAAERAAQQALFDSGAAWATPRVSGQWVVLEGTPPSEAAGLAAMNAVRNIKSPTLFGPAPPVTRVRARFTPLDNAAASNTASDARINSADAAGGAPAPTGAGTGSADWRYRLDDGVLRLTGQVPDEATRRLILTAAQATRDAPRISSIVNELSVIGRTPETGYLNIALRGVDAIEHCDRGEASFADSAFSLTCELPAGRADDLREILSTPLPFGRVGEVSVLENEAVASCDQALRLLLEQTQIRFETSSAFIDPASLSILDKIAGAALECPGSLQVEGHTDNRGRDSLNNLLSRRRADAVRQALIVRGLQPGRLIAQGYGSDRPVAGNDTDEGRAQNRRIEIRVARFLDDRL